MSIDQLQKGTIMVQAQINGVMLNEKYNSRRSKFNDRRSIQIIEIFSMQDAPFIVYLGC